MARTSAKAKKSKQEVNKKKEELEQKSKSSSDVEESKDSTDKENEDSTYEVEKIVHTRIFRGKRQYLIRWKGYKEDADTWETESALESSAELLEAFKKENLSLDEKKKDDETLDEKKTDVTGNGDIEENDEETEKEKVKAPKKSSAVLKKIKKSHQKTEHDNQESQNSTESENDTKETTSDDEQKTGKKRTLKKPKKDDGKKPMTETEEPKNKKSKQSEGSDDESVTDGKNYEVEKILEMHTRRDGTKEFLIRWKGYKSSDDTWEPEAHLDCQDMIDKFMERVKKAKSIPMKELRESRGATKRILPHFTARQNLRNVGFRPCYQE